MRDHPAEHANGYGIGHLYSCRHGAYSVVVAALTSVQARAAFQLFLSDRGIGVLPMSLAAPKSTRSIGERLLLIAQTPQGDDS